MLRYLFILLLAIAQVTFAQDFPAPKQPARLVNAYNDFLSQAEINRLESKLLAYADSTSTQIALIIINSTDGQDPNLYAAELGETWGVGKQGFDNGMVLLVASEDRTVTIQNGYGLEHVITDAASISIIQNHILPAFKQGQPYVGLSNGLDQIFKLLRGEYKADPKKSPGKKKKVPFFIIVIVLFVLFSLFKNRFGGPGSRGGGFSGGHGGAYWMGSMGGFGGGSFGGGGATGSW